MITEVTGPVVSPRRTSVPGQARRASYPVIDVLVGAMLYGANWSESAGPLAVATAWLVVLFGLGWVTLKRKVESL